jgi:nucleotide-binding universal stress UspA family protein
MALRFACSVAKHNGCYVDLLHVIEPADFQSFGAIANKMREEKRQEAELLLQSYAEEAQTYAGITPSIILREGNIEAEVVATIEEDHSINLVVLGTSPDAKHRRKLLPELVDHIGETIPVPVMIVPDCLTEHQIKQLSS